MASVFEDTFVCQEVDMVYKDPRNPALGKVREKKFDRVSRLVAESLHHKASLTLDVHSQLFPVRAGDRFLLSLMPSIRLDGAPCDGTFDQSGAPTIVGRYDYVMCGKVFQQQSEDARTAAVFISFRRPVDVFERQSQYY
ncbi:DNA-directed RNA polymerases I, II and III [Cyanidiococcus yangmingshanensis]|uniref:DNA-directed RNA polymerases I, II and III n=1 Tax=Cyanidiococcus yangmingshanensis TaxID=2690220 RepID=A0A7J7IQK0_9RHOD|nr:DNA-directed RNA polymerases I, II and III [Cyanidiococcus yangmingshanensis]